ncbi:hypothetical protein [uncultured Parabacteroides sp.]|uniref:hypothetical protein n=2 Tax=Parabacteroides TaxID=375288 RepID=UPI0025D65F71|nr:hypothetical protein [uncultured Parabacteroides sp.]
MARRTRLFSGIPVADFHDDRLHRHDDRLRCRELPCSLCMNIDFMAMKTVVMEIFCATHGQDVPKTTFSVPGTIVRKTLDKGTTGCFNGVFYNK